MPHLKRHSFTGDTDHDFTGLVSGQLIQYDGSSIVSSGFIGTSADLWSASTGSNAIIANNGSGNWGASNRSVVIGENNTGGTINSFVAGKQNDTNSSASNSSILGGYKNSISNSYSFIGSGAFNNVSANRSGIGSGQQNEITSA